MELQKMPTLHLVLLARDVLEMRLDSEADRLRAAIQVRDVHV